MTTSDANDDPYERHFQRDPLPQAGIRIIQVVDSPGDAASAVVAPLIELVRELGRPVECHVVPMDGDLSEVLGRGLAGASLPLVLVTTALRPWNKAHLTPLLEAIDRCDHVIGRRPAGTWGSCIGWLASLPRRIVFALPIFDVNSPCQMHRLERLARIPLQSASSFLNVEVLAKATFFGDLIDEVEVPALEGRNWSRGAWADWSRVLRHPLLAPPSGPAKEPQREREGDDGPRGQDGESRAHLDRSGTEQENLPQR
jgi:hypothetical protein